MNKIAALTIVFIAAQLAACVQNTATDEGASSLPSGPSKDEVFDNRVGKGDDANVVDHCEENGWYGDGECDNACPKPDPDCENVEYRTCSQFGLEFCGEGEYCHYDHTNPVLACGISDTAGTCRPLPDNCLEHAHTFCGCDGTSYNNACEAARAGINIVSEGPCPGDNAGECQINDDCSPGQICEAYFNDIDEEGNEIFINRCISAEATCGADFGSCPDGQACFAYPLGDGEETVWRCEDTEGDGECGIDGFGACPDGQVCIDYPEEGADGVEYTAFRCMDGEGDGECGVDGFGTCPNGDVCVEYIDIDNNGEEYTAFRCMVGEGDGEELCGDEFGACPLGQACFAYPLGEDGETIWRCEDTEGDGECGVDGFGDCPSGQVCIDYPEVDLEGNDYTAFRCMDGEGE